MKNLYSSPEIVRDNTVLFDEKKLDGLISKKINLTKEKESYDFKKTE